jgi:hypothetical protein
MDLRITLQVMLKQKLVTAAKNLIREKIADFNVNKRAPRLSANQNDDHYNFKLQKL